MMKNRIRQVHRWIGLFASFFLAGLALTGILLGFALELKLESVRVKQGWILAQYGMHTADAISSFSVGKSEHAISSLGEMLYFDTTSLGNADPLIGIMLHGPLLIVATENELILLTENGELIEKTAVESLPFERILKIGKSEFGDPLLFTDAGFYKADDEWLSFETFDGAFHLEKLVDTEVDEGTKQDILTHYQGQGVSLHRFILDLHSGRFFGFTGRFMVILTGLCMLILVVSGVMSFFKFEIIKAGIFRHSLGRQREIDS